MRRNEIYLLLKADFRDSVEDRQIKQWAQIYYEDCILKSKADCPVIKEFIQRLMNGEPIQYIVKNARFYNLDLYVDKSVLIPRPETEELVFLIKERHDVELPYKVLDLGSGSGCIPLLLKNLCPMWSVNGSDVSEEVIRVAERNATANNLHVEFLKLDILNSGSWEQLKDKSIDILTSNPPYIPQDEIEGLMSEVRNYEPHLALVVPDNNPCVFYTAIAELGFRKLKPGGMVYCELHPQYADECAHQFKRYSHVEVLKDMQGENRFLLAQL